MRRLLLLARSKSSAFAGVELSVAVLLVVLGGLLLPSLQRGGITAAHSRDADPPRHLCPLADGQDQTASVAVEDAPAGPAQPVIGDGSVRKIKFDVNAGTFQQPPKPHDNRPLEDDY